MTTGPSHYWIGASIDEDDQRVSYFGACNGCERREEGIDLARIDKELFEHVMTNCGFWARGTSRW